MASNKIVLYTNHHCPWAHRAHIALKSLGLEYEEHIIDLQTPRTPEYLAINPRGLVPTLVYDGEIIPESGIVAQFLADKYPGKLVKASNEEGGALERARISFFVDAFVSKSVPKLFAGIKAQTDEERETVGDEFVEGIKKEVEGLLADAAPYFGGRSEIGLAEVLTASWALRFLDAPTHGFANKSLLTKLEKETPNFWKWAKNVTEQEAVTYIWRPEEVAAHLKKKFGIN